jgi:hypothetical protein
MSNQGITMENNPLQRLYGVFGNPQTYLNLLYLLLAFPLGIAYFTFLVTGFSLGLGLLIVWIGFIILPGVLAFCWVLTIFERHLAIALLRVEIPSAPAPTAAGSTFLEQIKTHLTNPATWKGIAYLLLKFPIGIASFVITVTLISVSAGLLTAPLVFPWAHIDFGFVSIGSLPTALIAFVFGLIVAPLSLHVLNIVAAWQGQFARFMLAVPAGSRSVASTPFQPDSTQTAHSGY